MGCKYTCVDRKPHKLKLWATHLMHLDVRAQRLLAVQDVIVDVGGNLQSGRFLDAGDRRRVHAHGWCGTQSVFV